MSNPRSLARVVFAWFGGYAFYILFTCKTSGNWSAIGPGGRMMEDTNTPATGNGANLGFEADLWCAADALRSNMDAERIVGRTV